MKKTVFLLLFFAMLFCSYLTAQTLAESIVILSDDAAKAYVNPIVSAFGANINGGWFHQAPKAQLLGWDLEISAIAMVSPFDSSDKTFTKTGNFRFTKDQARTLTANLESDLSPSQYDALLNAITDQYFPVNISGPTIIGKDYDPDHPDNTSIQIGFPSTDVHYSVEGVPGEQVETVNAMSIVLPVGGIMDKYPALPLTTTQLTIGTLAGTKMSIRYLPEIKMVNDLGSLKYFGIGIQHNPAVWFPIPIPVDFALSLVTQSLQIGNLASATATNVGINVSKTFGPRLMSVTPYAGLSYETSNMQFKYTYVVDNSLADPIKAKIKFDVNGGNDTRMTAGVSFRAAIVNLNFDYNLAKYPSFTTGLGVNFSW